MATVPQEWFLNTPVLWAGAVVLIAILRGPLRRAPVIIKKLLQLTTVSLILLGFLILLVLDPVIRTSKEAPLITALWMLGFALTPIIWLIAFFRIVRRKEQVRSVRPKSVPLTEPPAASALVQTIPAERFADIGSMEDTKEQIGALVLAQLNPAKYERYGILQNGILLHGPRGTGKTFLAKATAGEFGLHFEYVSAPDLLNRFIGATGTNIQQVFAQAAAHRPVLLFIDEIDGLGTGRQEINGGGDPGGAGREFNNIAIALMSAIDQYRSVNGFVLMAATNRLDGLDEALIREGRFDVKIRVDLPDEAARAEILRAQLSKKPWKKFDLQEFARITPGASAARLRALVDHAASFALTGNRKIEADDLRRAIYDNGGKDRPLVERVEWEDVIVEESVLQDLKSLVRLLDDPVRTRSMGLESPTGLLLVGPPGTGKTLIARLIASQTKRSFYPLTAANVLGAAVGDSVKRVTGIFARAKEHSPSLIFLDEMDGLLPANTQYASQHDIQVVEQFLTEISSLQPEHNVFLVGTTNHPESIDARVLRGGRFSEKITIALPDTGQRLQLLTRYLEGARLGPELRIEQLAERLTGLSPADLRAVCTSAKRMAFNRMPNGDRLAPLNWSDFEKAVERVPGETIQLGRTTSH